MRHQNNTFFRSKLWKQFWQFQQKNNGFSILQRYYERHLTATGKALLLLQTVSLSLGLVGTEVLIYMFMCSLGALWLAVIMIGLAAKPRRWTLSEFKPSLLSVHQLGTLNLEVKNAHPWPLFQAQVEAYLLPTHLPRSRFMSSRQHDYAAIRLRSDFIQPVLNNAETAVFSMSWSPTARGKYTLRSLSLVSLFPLRLMRWRKVKKIDYSLWVYPEITPPPPTKKNTAHAPGNLSRISASRQRAEHLAGVRPWRQGDSPRLIHWAGFARTGQLAVKEFQSEKNERVGLLFYGKVNPSDNGESELFFEDALSLMAGFLQQTLAQDSLAFLQAGTLFTQDTEAQTYWQALSETLPNEEDTIPWKQQAWNRVSHLILVANVEPFYYADLQQLLHTQGTRLSCYLPALDNIPPRKSRALHAE